MDVDWRGFELHPETPPGGVDLDVLFGRRREAMHAYMRDFAASFGIRDMRQPDRLPNTRRALAVAEYARDHGRVDIFRRLAMNAYWRDGRDLEDPLVLGDIARGSALDAAEAVRATGDEMLLDRVDEIRREASRMGVTGIPTFFFGDAAVVGCQPYEVLAAAARAAGAPRRGDA